MVQLPFTDVHAAVAAVESYSGSPEDFTLSIADTLQDPVGMYMAIITDSILAKGWEPHGFEQRENFRIYKNRPLRTRCIQRSWAGDGSSDPRKLLCSNPRGVFLQPR